MHQCRRHAEPVRHWLDRAIPEHGEKLVADIKSLLRVLVIFLPLPVFWTLFDQQGSRWVLQATQMDGRIGAITIKPDQMQSANAVLILILIPIFNYIVYPTCRRLGIRLTPLRRMGAGMVLSGVAFVVAGFVQIAIDNGQFHPSYAGAQSAQVRLINAYPGAVVVNVTMPEQMVYGASMAVGGSTAYTQLVGGTGTLQVSSGSSQWNSSLVLQAQQYQTVLITQPSPTSVGAWTVLDPVDSLGFDEGYCAVRFIHADNALGANLVLLTFQRKPALRDPSPLAPIPAHNATAFASLLADTYTVLATSVSSNGTTLVTLGDVQLVSGGVYVFVLSPAPPGTAPTASRLDVHIGAATPSPLHRAAARP